MTPFSLNKHEKILIKSRELGVTAQNWFFVTSITYECASVQVSVICCNNSNYSANPILAVVDNHDVMKRVLKIVEIVKR